MNYDHTTNHKNVHKDMFSRRQYWPLLNGRGLRSALTLWCIAVLLGLASVFSSSLVHAQNAAVSSALDSPQNNFTSEYFRINTSEFTTGDSSLEITTYPFNCCRVHVTAGIFERNQTITFDYRYDQNSPAPEYVGIEVMRPDRTDLFDVFSLPPTNGQWCRRSFYITDGENPSPAPQMRVEWQTDKAPFSRSTLIWDNIQSQPGNNVKPPRCVDDPKQLGGRGGAPVAVIAMLLDDEGDGSLRCGPTNAIPRQSPGRFYGRVSLPDDVVAPAGGVEVEVATSPLDFQFDGLNFLVSNTDVTIPAGEREACYEIDLFTGASESTKRLTFECLSGCDNLNVVTNAFWSDNVGATNFFSATNYPVFQDTPVNIELQEADVFSGIINFPAGTDANGNEQFAVRAEAVYAGFVFPFEDFTAFVNPDEGQTSIPFLLGARNNIPGLLGWTLSISCIGCDSDIVSARVFATAANGGVLSLQEGDAFEFDNGANHSGINLNLLENVP